MNKKTGMLSVALAKVRALKFDVKRLSEELIASHDRCDGLRKANEHASVVCGDAQKSAKLLRIALFQKAVDNDKLTEAAKSQGDEISRLKAELFEQTVRADNLYDANRKFAFDDNEYRLEAVAAQNRLVNDNLHLSDEVESLKDIIDLAGVAHAKTFDALTAAKAELGSCLEQLDVARREVAAWIKNPVNEELDKQNKHLDMQLRTLFVQADEMKNQRDQLIDCNVKLQKELGIQDDKIRRLGGTVNSFKAAYVEAKNGYEKLRAGTLKTNEIYNKELAKERGKHDIRLVGAKQRITELEAALNYLNGLCQQGAPDLVGRLQAELATLRGVLEEKDILIRKHEGQIQHLNSCLDCKVRANFDLSEKLSELIKASSRTPFYKLWTRWINKV